MKMRKAIALSLAIMILVAASVMGTIAWLQDTTNSVVNTFKVGNVDITLKESPFSINDEGKKVYGTPAEGQDNEYPALPGATYKKDPVVTVVANSEDCYLFVKFEYTNDVKTYYNFTSNLKAPEWEKLESASTVGADTTVEVWCKQISKSENDTPFALLAKLNENTEDTIEVSKTAVTNDTTDEASAQKLTWTAYAIQKDNINAADGKSAVEVAWETVKDLSTTYPANP